MKPLALVFFLPSVLFGSVITGPLKDAGLDTSTFDLRIRPLDTPFSYQSTNTIMSATKVVRVTRGAFSATLLDGLYEVKTPYETLYWLVPEGVTNTSAQVTTNLVNRTWPALGAIENRVLLGTGLTATTNNAGADNSTITLNGASSTLSNITVYGTSNYISGIVSVTNLTGPLTVHGSSAATNALQVDASGVTVSNAAGSVVMSGGNVVANATNVISSAGSSINGVGMTNGVIRLNGTQSWEYSRFSYDSLKAYTDFGLTSGAVGGGAGGLFAAHGYKIGFGSNYMASGHSAYLESPQAGEIILNTNLTARGSITASNALGSVVMSGGNMVASGAVTNNSLTVGSASQFRVDSSGNLVAGTVVSANNINFKDGSFIQSQGSRFYNVPSGFEIKSTSGDNNQVFSSSNGLFSLVVLTNRLTIRTNTAEPAAVAGAAQLYSLDVSGVSEMFVQGSDGTETQISSHPADAPTALYDTNKFDLEQHILREVNPFVTNGVVRWINTVRMARITELNTKAILFLSGKTSAGNSNALVKLQDMSNDERQVIIKESFAEYNARNPQSRQLVPKIWEVEEQKRQVAYDAERAATIQQVEWLTETNNRIASALVAWTNEVAQVNSTNAIINAQNDSMRAEYEAAVASVVLSNAVIQAEIDSGNTNLTLLPMPAAPQYASLQPLPPRPNDQFVALPTVPPAADIRRPKPAWMTR